MSVSDGAGGQTDGHRTIALLTPYSGRNLGDGAIQATFIAHLRARCANVDLIGLTENPGCTQQIHGIRCYPLGAAARAQGNSVAGADPAASPGGEQPHRARAAAILRVLKAVPALRWAANATRTAFGSLRRGAMEIAEWRHTWRLLRGVDLLIVAGGGQLDEEWGGPWSHPLTLWRWTLCARLRGTAVAFASVGAGVLKSRLGTFFMRQSLARSSYRSYRDPGTKQMLAQFQFVRQDPIVPDIAFGLPVDPETVASGSAGNGRTLGIVPMIFGHADFWPTANVEVYRRYIRELRHAMISMLDAGWHVSLFVTNSVDKTAVDDLTRGIEATQPSHQRLRVISTSSLGQLLGALASCQLIVASRLHAVVLSQRLAKPIIAISFDRKVEAQMGLAGLEEFCVDIRQFEHADLLRLLSHLEPRVSEVEAQLRSYLGVATESLQRQFDELVGLSGSRRGM